jgi:hypothetical protein
MRSLVIFLAVVFVACSGGDDPDPATDSTTPTTASDGAAEVASPLVSVPVSDLGADHVDPPVSYEQSPSIGGDHYPFWQNCGFYDVELLEGAATHTMEHGAVWITYNSAKLTDAELSTLEGIAQDNGKLLISPYTHDEKLILSAWGVQLRSSLSPSDPAVSNFIDEWIDNPELAEAGVRCDGAAGIPPNDVRTLSGGDQVPDEFS